MVNEQLLTEVTAFNDPNSKWFRNSSMDLTVSFASNGEISSFQIDYRERQKSYSLSWLDFKLRHYIIDDGELDPERNMTPIVLGEITENRDFLIRDFERASKAIPPPIRKFVLENLGDAPDSLA